MASPAGSKKNATLAEREATLAEEALVGQWADRIKKRKQLMQDVYDEWNKLRDYASGHALQAYLVKTNLVASTLGTLVPHIYARDPQISVRPSLAVDPARYEAVQAFSQTAEAFVDRQFKDGELKNQAKRCVRSALTVGISWIKIGLQTSTSGIENPQIMRQIEDVRQQLDTLAALNEEIKEGEDPQTREAQIAQRTDTLRALEQQRDMLVSKGFTFDVVKAEDVLWDGDLEEILDYRFGKWMAQGFWLRNDSISLAQYNLNPDDIQGATAYTSNALKGGGKDTQTSGQGDPERERTQPASGERANWFRGWEIWDKQTGTIYTWLEGLNKWIKPPFAPTFEAQRFYPFFLLGFNYVDGKALPVPDVSGWMGLQDEYCRTRSAYALTRARSIPARWCSPDLTKGDNKLAIQLADPEAQELLAIDTAGQPIETMIGMLPIPEVDMALYDTSAIRADLDFVSGLQDAAKGGVVQAKTATEANIQQSGTLTRLSAKNDAIEDWVREIGLYVLEIGLQAYNQVEIGRMLGNGTTWPQLSKGEIYGMVELSVQGGSSGKPNKLGEQQAWAVLMPQLQQAVLQIAQFRARAVATALQIQASGNANPAAMVPVQIQNAIADALEAIVRESFRRADERLDPDEFIPKIQMPQMQAPPQTPLTGEANAQPTVAPGQTSGQPSNPTAIEQFLANLGIPLEPTGPGPALTPEQENPGNI